MQTRCECRNLSFAKLILYARRHGLGTLAELIAATGCCTGCGSCRPLLEELLRSGKLRVGDRLIDLPKLPDEPVDLGDLGDEPTRPRLRAPRKGRKRKPHQ